MDPELRDAAGALSDLARADVGMARLGCQDLGQYANYVAFHCQQAVEKIVKACLVAVGVDPPLTHNLRLLSDLLRSRGLPPLGEADAEVLGAFAVGPRYGAWHVSAEEALAALEAAEGVLGTYESVLRGLLDEAGPGGQ
jgi:HEPN domain-containing protein